jgi:hypothetical protein
MGSIGIAAGSALLLALLFLAVAGTPASAAPGHSVLRTISTGPNSGPRAIATDSAGNLYVAETGARRVEKVDPAGNPLPFTGLAKYIEGSTLVGTPAGQYPELNGWRNFGIAVDSSGGPNEGHIYFTIEGENESRTFAYDSTGIYLGRLGSEAGYRCGGAVHPTDGSVYIGQEYAFPGGIQRFAAPSGDLEEAVPNGELENTAGCPFAVDATGAVYFGGGPFGGGIVKYPASQFGESSPTASIEFEPTGASALALDPTNGDLYADKGNEIVRFDAAGAQQGSRFGQLSESRGIAVDGARNVSATDSGGGVFVFDPDEVQLPIGVTGGSANVVATAADVEGSVDPDGAGDITACEFRYGEDTGYSGGSVPCTPATPIASPTAVSAHLGNLVSGTTYHYRLFITNASGTQMGTGDQTFTTPPATADVTAEPATEIEKDSAVLNGSYTGNGEDVHYFFEWGKTNGYGNTTPVPPGAGAGTGTGAQDVAPVQISGLDATTVYHYRLVVSTAAGITRSPDQTFTTAVPVTNLTADKPSPVSETSAALRASFDGDGAYETSYYFEWGQTAAYGNTVPAPPGNTVPPGTGRIDVPAVTISGLQSGGATYHFRVVASNATGTSVSADQTFRTAIAPVISNLQSRNVSATSATLAGAINPRNGETTYQFEWGTTPAYGTSTPVPAGSVGSGEAPIEVTAQLEDLSPGFTYHFRIVATNPYGTTVSPDQSFGFYPPKCPNSQVRQETRSNHLPDCRGYELVSPSFAQGTAIMASSGPTSGVATNPPRLAYAGTWGLFPDEVGEATASFSDAYVSTRRNGGWVQRYVGLRADQAMLSAGPPGAAMFSPQFTVYQSLQRGTQATPGLDKFLSYDWGFPGQLATLGQGKNAPYVWDTTTGDALGRWPTNLGDVAGGENFVGLAHASSDFTHLVFSSNLVFAEGGQESAAQVTCCGTPSPAETWLEDYVYDNDIESGDVVLASRKSSAQGDAPFKGRALNVSDDGSRILIADEAQLGNGKLNPFALMEPDQEARFAEITGPLYLRVDAERTIEIGGPHQLRYAGSSPDGRRIYITSAEQLTADDKDSSRDLFVWEESEPDGLTRLSFGDHESAGDTDACAPDEGWTANCGITLPDINHGISTDGSVGNGLSDSYFASEGDDIYFESPEQLQGQLGQVGQRNLYLYRDGTVRFVATLRPNAPVTRMQVTPNGEHMAFITASDLTDYSSSGRRQMYRYSPLGGPVGCVSCRPDGLAPVSDAMASANGLFLTRDGRAFFSTADSLVPRDTNELEDIYEFTEAKAQLITTGIGPGIGKTVIQSVNAPGLIGVSLNGTDVYFATIDNLVTQDHNGAQIKIYDARVDGGFPAEREEPKCVAADECHGPSSSAMSLPPDRTSAPIGESTSKPKAKTKKKKKKASKKKKRHKKTKNKRKKRGKRHG